MNENVLTGLNRPLLQRSAVHCTNTLHPTWLHEHSNQEDPMESTSSSLPETIGQHESMVLFIDCTSLDRENSRGSA